MENHQLSFAAKTPTDSAAAVVDENSESQQYCAICLNDICGGAAHRELPECRHSFHSNCIDAWLRSHSTCPLCRAQLTQIISLDKNHYEWNDFVSSILVLIQDFLHKMSNPLNEELSSMLCAKCEH